MAKTNGVTALGPSPVCDPYRGLNEKGFELHLQRATRHIEM